MLVLVVQDVYILTIIMLCTLHENIISRIISFFHVIYW